MYRLILTVCLLTASSIFFSRCQTKNSFTLVDNKNNAVIILAASEPECVRLAVQDLTTDIEKITGSRIAIENQLSQGDTRPKVIVGTAGLSDSNLNPHLASYAQIKGKWEAYQIQSADGNLVIAGSDERGTMFGVYRFIEDFLGVDPLYFWSDHAPEKKSVLTWDNISVTQASPTFNYRGWFINDEDLLSEWHESGGVRNIDYAFYGQVVNPDIMEKVVESLVRLRMNLIIPASFIDIRNPAEARLVQVAAKRGVFLSMHHIEPMGVSAFTFFNYWKEKTGEKPLFSFFSSREKLEEVWRVYAEEWAKYPNVIWQIGLRGIADRPMWMADPGISQNSEDRGKLISEAMQTQRELIASVDKRPSPPMTTTLWMEGSALNKEGFLKIPENTTIVFSDNSPGWKWQDDFYQTDRIPENTYGVYYHHQLWGSGPHLAQGVPPHQTYRVFKDAVEKGATEYAILNVSNIRQFLLGLSSSGQLLYNFDQYSPETFVKNWAAGRFDSNEQEVTDLYQAYFDGFVMSDSQKVPMLLDGQIRSFARTLLSDLKKQLADPVKYEREQKAGGQNKNIVHDPNLAISDMHPKPKDNGELLEKAMLQKKNHGAALEKGLAFVQQLNPEEQELLNTNIISHLKIMIGLEDWLIAILKTKNAWNDGDKEEARAAIQEALNAFTTIRDGQHFHVKGEKWENWYRGEKKMNINDCEALTNQIALLINAK